MKVTPYEVEGEIDYDRLVQGFGASRLTPDLIRKIKNPPLLLRRGHFYAHRDFDKILKEKKFAIVSGRGPSENMTLGHLATFKFVKEIQDRYGCYVFIPFSDDEKFLYKDITYEEARQHCEENALDIIALGFDPKKTEFMFDLGGMKQDIYNLSIKCAKRMTFSMIKDSLGFIPSNNIGSIFYPAMQAAHILYPTVKYDLPVVVVIGIDQDILVRLSRDAAFKLGLRKPADLLSKFLPSLTGDGKMSASDPNSAIYTTDNEKTIKKKLNNAFSGGQETIEKHRKLGGNPDIDACFQYLKLFFEEDDKKLKQIEKDYRSGKLLSGELKKYTIEKAVSFLKQHQAKRKQARKNLSKFLSR